MVFACVLPAACRCDPEPEPSTSSNTRREPIRLELTAELGDLPGPALTLAWTRATDSVVGLRGALRRGSERYDAPAYLGAPLVVSGAEVYAWPYVLRESGAVELPVPAGAPVSTAVWTPRHGWVHLRADGESRELVVSGRVSAVPGASLLTVDDTRLLAAGSRVWLLADDRARELPAPRYETVAAILAGRRALGLDAAGQLTVWDLDASPVSATTQVAHLGAGRALATSGDLLASAGADGRVVLWRLSSLPPAEASSEPVAETRFAGPVDALAWGEDGTELIVALREGGRSRLVQLHVRD